MTQDGAKMSQDGLMIGQNEAKVGLGQGGNAAGEGLETCISGQFMGLMPAQPAIGRSSR